MTALMHALSLSLLHFVWQGLLVAGLLWVLLFAMRRRSANSRYVLSCVALAVLALMPVVTMYVLLDRPWNAGAIELALAPARITPSSLPQNGNWLVFVQSWAVPIWCAGVLLFSLRLVYGSAQVAALRRRGEPAEGHLLFVVSTLAARMGVKGRFAVLTSKLADGPGVAGLVRPVILLPAATVLGLSPEQLEAVLAHELAHIRRYDYLVNVAQMLVEALLFYHPAVWWVSARVRRERELCCDDEAVRVCGDSLCYARALTALERLRMSVPEMALGVTDGPLAYRVKRLLGVSAEETLPSKLPGIVALCLALACLGVSINRARGQAAPDGPGVKVDLGSSIVIHRTPVEYPAAARDKSIQGTVSVEVRLDSSGNVSDARVLSGPDEFRKAVLQSVLSWHFPPEGVGSTKVVNVQFQTPPPQTLAVAKLDDSGVRHDVEATTQFLQEELRQLEANLQQAQAQLGQNQDAIKARGVEIQAREAQIRDLEMKLLMARRAEAVGTFGPVPQVLEGRKVHGIRIVGLGIPVDDFLAQAQLPIHVEDVLTQSLAEATVAAVKRFDEHLRVLWMSYAADPNGVEIMIDAAPAAPAGNGGGRGRGGAGVGGGIGGGTGGGPFPDAANSTDSDVSAPVAVYQPQPEYTEEARKAKWQGSVLVAVVIDDTGKVVDATITKPLGMGLEQKAMAAVWQWRFKPGTKDGQPVPVHANIEVNFRLR
jgi:TonB family protein